MKKWIYTVVMSMFVLVLGGCSNSELKEPPSIIVKVDGEELQSEKGGYEWTVRKWFSGQSVIADAMAPNQIAEELKLRAEKVYTNAIARITFTDGSMPELKAFLWDEEKEIRELSVSGQDVSLPHETGRQIIEVRGKWPNGEASYTFVVEVE